MTREEAIETVRRCCPCISDSECDFETAMRVLIPELKECEDERIRKWIINFIEVRLPDAAEFEPEYRAALAWLEKQKEQKPKLIGEDSVEKKARQMYETGQTIEEQKPVEGFCSSKGLRGRIGDTPKDIRERAEKFRDGMEAPYDADDICSAYESGAMDERKKPAEWSGEDEAMLNRIIETLSLPPIYDTKACAVMVCWLKSLPLNLKKKNEDVTKLCSNEWSEEDEKMKERLITRLNWITYNTRTDGTSPNITFFDEIEWLKSLRPQPKKSDTYYDIIHNILDMLNGMDFMKITPEHRVSLLNDIRVKCKNADECAAILDEPQWKPSEEQMKGLLVAIGDEKERGSDVVKPLRSLYKDLKKL